MGERGGPARLIAAGSLLSCLLYIIFCVNVTVVAMPLVIENRSLVRDNAIECWRQWRGENTKERCDFKVNVTRGETVAFDVRPPKNKYEGWFCFLGFKKRTILLIGYKLGTNGDVLDMRRCRDRCVLRFLDKTAQWLNQETQKWERVGSSPDIG